MQQTNAFCVRKRDTYLSRCFCNKNDENLKLLFNQIRQEPLLHQATDPTAKHPALSLVHLDGNAVAIVATTGAENLGPGTGLRLKRSAEALERILLRSLTRRLTSI